MEPQTILLWEESLYYGATSDLCSDMDGVQYPDDCYKDDFSFHWSTVKGTESRRVRPSSPVYVSWQTAHPSPISGKGNTPLLDHRWKEDLHRNQILCELSHTHSVVPLWTQRWEHPEKQEHPKKEVSGLPSPWWVQSVLCWGVLLTQRQPFKALNSSAFRVRQTTWYHDQI